MSTSAPPRRRGNLLGRFNSTLYLEQDPRRIIVEQLEAIDDQNTILFVISENGSVFDQFFLYNSGGVYIKRNVRTEEALEYNDTTEIANSINESISRVIRIRNIGTQDERREGLWDLRILNRTNPRNLLENLLQSLLVRNNNKINLIKVTPLQGQEEYTLTKTLNGRILAEDSSGMNLSPLSILDTLNLFYSYRTIQFVLINIRRNSLIYQQFLWNNPDRPFIINNVPVNNPEQPPVIINNNQNQSQLQLVQPPEPVPPITRASYPGQCVICQEPIEGQGCRVNCQAGHIFHCDCINQWRNTHQTTFNLQEIGEWHNECPLCRQEISQMYYVEITPEIQSATAFGKKRFTVREITKMIKYLNKLK
uniref:RING-type domain-containing protein n=1 Tax=viral metagenome TaxID=1070528 RepID=A0A6C0IA89_9ZZZZ